MNTPSDHSIRLNSRTKMSVKGFSLVEITLSLGLMSFALVSTLGLLPTGLSTLRSSMNQTVEAQIVQSLANRTVISRFENVTTDTLYFDEEGLPVESRNLAYYTAELTPGTATFPGSANAVSLADSLMNVQVSLETRPNPSVAGRKTIYSLQIANSGK